MKSRKNASLWAVAPLLALAVLPASVHAQAGSAGQGQQQYMAYCSPCHGADGKGGDKVASLATKLSALTLSEAELSRIVHDGTGGGMPSFAQIGDANITAIVGYLRRLEGETQTDAPLPGDAGAGRALFYGMAQCSNCHMVAGQGGFIAQDLTVYGKRRGSDAIEQAIAKPDLPLAPSSRVAEVTTRTGKKITGVVRNEDNFNVELQTEDGRYHLLARSNLKEVSYTDHSLMPRDYGTRLTSREMDDLVSFLMVTSRNNSSETAITPEQNVTTH